MKAKDIAELLDKPTCSTTRKRNPVVPSLARRWAERDTFNLYLVNSSDHCSKLCNDAESASGIVLAEVIADDR